jgi:uncharacterized membrane protein
MIEFLRVYFSVLIPLLLIDLTWLGLVAKNFYAKYLGFLISSRPNLLAALLFYLIYSAGVVIFVLWPKYPLGQTILFAAFFGLCAYATYDLTNLATIKDFPVAVVLVDLLWGVLVTVIVSALAFFLAGKF